MIREFGDYKALITSQHVDKRKFIETLEATLSANVYLQRAGVYDVVAISVDSSIGVQLDWIGEWVGISRRVPTPITGVYFAWDDTAATGWDSGIWKGDFDPDSGLTELPDDDYRIIIKAKIQANIRSRGILDIYAILDAAFPGNTIDVVDNQDMTMDVNYTIADFTPVQKAILDQDLIPIKPCGVTITYTGS